MLQKGCLIDGIRLTSGLCPRHHKHEEDGCRTFFFIGKGNPNSVKRRDVVEHGREASGWQVETDEYGVKL